MQIAMVELANIEYGTRFREDFGDLEGLISSILREGLIQPLAVLQAQNGEPYRLLAGGRRYQACLQAGVKEVPVRIFDQELSELEMRSIELAENIFRKDLSWDEEVKLKREIHLLQVSIHGEKTNLIDPNAPGWSQKATADMLGESSMNISRDLRLAEALEKIPGLAEACETKSDAAKLLKRIGVNMAAKEMAQKVESSQRTTPTAIQHSKLIDAYILKDFFDGVKDIPSGSIDIVEMDPPYSIDLVGKREMRGGSGNAIGYNEVDKRQYVEFLTLCFYELYRVMSQDSWLLCWYAIHPWHSEVLGALEKANFKCCGIPALWIKPCGATMNPQVMLGSSYEPFFYARKGSPVLVKMGASNTFFGSKPSNQTRIHPTERPIELIQEVLATFAMPTSKLLVPFLGSGNTLLAASNLGIQGYGYDLSEEFRSHYILRVTASQPGQYRTYGNVNLSQTDKED